MRWNSMPQNMRIASREVPTGEKGVPMKLKLHLAGLSIAVTAGIVSSGAIAQGTGNYPSKPVRVILPQAAGGATDLQARLFAQALSKNLGKSFVVENKAGGGNTIGTQFVAREAPDGYTLLATTPSFTFGPALRELPYDPIKDFTPITL